MQSFARFFRRRAGNSKEKENNIVMKTLIIFGGARENGKTMQMVNYFLERLGGEQQRLDCYSLKISPCMDCRRCQTQNNCAIHDDMQKYYELIDEADNIVFAAPIYFYSTPGPMKVFIDRLQLYWASRIRKDRGNYPRKTGTILLSAGAPDFKDQFTAALLEINAVFHELNVENVGTVLMGSADRTELSDRTEIIEQLDQAAGKMKRGR